MTVFLPLNAAEPFPSSPAFLVPSPDPKEHIKRVVKTILSARRVIVVCGAGISVQAGIPDFRSSEGLFRSLRKKHPALTSGKNLFDVSVFSSEDTTSLFFQMIGRLSQLSEAAEPTPFHRFLRVLDDRRRLLRVYTQNVDALEEKSGLTFGVPGSDFKWTNPHSGQGNPSAATRLVEILSADTGSSHESPAAEFLAPLAGSPTVGAPKCIPLHGTLQLMHCMACAQSYPLCEYIDYLISGSPPPCPQCVDLEVTRRLVGKRSRGIGKLRPSIVLYNEEHRNGEEVGDVVRKDLKGRADLLLVVGTSLRVPGTKRIVREFSKAVQSLRISMNTSRDKPAGKSTMAAPLSRRRHLKSTQELDVRTVYVNLDFPVPIREWEGVFDAWVQGDAQVFARMVHDELENEEQVGGAVKDRKRKREEEGLNG